jgi:hypothetical protein
MGQAVSYPADPSLAARTRTMAERRQVGWTIVKKVLEPQTPLELPRFQTWYSAPEIMVMFRGLFEGLSDQDRKARRAFTGAELDSVFPWNAARAPTLSTWSQEVYEARRAELTQPEGRASLGMGTRTLFSPALVRHFLGSYARAISCPSGLCFDGQMPSDAVAIKARWLPETQTFREFDTSPGGVQAAITRGDWGAGDPAPPPGPGDIYTMRGTDGVTRRLVALHIMTKEAADWIWITMWWSKDPDPDALPGRWSHYKMCIVTSYQETDPSLPAGPTFCSNPYLETGPHNVQTNCIGCHQHGGTDLSNQTILTQYPENGRAKSRSEFPYDYLWAASGNLRLVEQTSGIVDLLTP